MPLFFIMPRLCFCITRFDGNGRIESNFPSMKALKREINLGVTTAVIMTSFTAGTVNAWRRVLNGIFFIIVQENTYCEA